MSMKKIVHMVHIGKKPPKGWEEFSAQHIGKGIWAITCKKDMHHMTVIAKNGNFTIACSKCGKEQGTK